MNVMLTCAGRRNYLVKFFQEVLGNSGLVFAADSSIEAATLQEADRGFVLPPIDNPDYFDRLLDICQKQQVRLLIPLNDLELPLLARQRDRFLKIGTIPVISTPAAIDTCFDKWSTFQFLTRCGILCPQTYLSLADARQAIASGAIAFPVVIKPRWGSASIGVEYAENDEELELFYRFVQKTLRRTILANVSALDAEHCIIIQEKVCGQEYGLDIVDDLEGNYRNTLARRKLYMRAGETAGAVTTADKQLQALGEKIADQLGHFGNLDCDVIANDRGLYVIEMNARFGGGYPFSHLAGANLPATLIAWANGEKPDPDWLSLTANVMMSKCDRLVFHKQWE